MCGTSPGPGPGPARPGPKFNFYGTGTETGTKLKLPGPGSGPNRNPKLYEIVNFVIFGRYLTQIFKKSSKKPSTCPPIFENFGFFCR
jgi:hypothetical protein